LSKSRKQRRKREGPSRSRPKADPTGDTEDLSAEERARALGDAKASFVSELVGYVLVVGILSQLLPVIAAIVGFFGGLHLLGHFKDKILYPSLRRRWVDRELVSMSAQRRRVGGGHTRRMEELSASIAHEIRNPITAAKSLVEQVGEEPGSDDNVEYARVALEELNRVERSISNLLRFAKEEDMELQEVRVDDVVDSALRALSDRVERGQVQVVTEVDTEAALLGDPEKLRRVLLNLIGNALDVLAESKTQGPRLDVQAGENLAGTEVWIRVRDNGPGMSPERAERIFSPFYTAREGGTGLGLAITQKLVSAHGGEIEVDSELGRGTEFIVTLPRAAPAG
jgi:two-component system sensor histidine kinase HydH